MINKYNSWEDVKESFCPMVEFECEGEIFKRLRFESYPNPTTKRGVSLTNTKYGIVVRIYYEYAVDVFEYYKV